MRNFFSKKRVNRRLKEVSRFSRAKHGKGNIQKSVLHEQSCFLLIRKKVCCTCKVFFFANQKKLSVLHVQSCCRCCCCCLLIRSIVALFYRSRCFHPVSSITPLSLFSPCLQYYYTRFYIFFEETISIKESFAFSPGQIYILS